MTPRALMLSPELPYPVKGGGALRIASLLNYLAQHHTVDLILFRHLDSQAPLESLPPGLVDRVLVLELPRHSRSTVARAIRNARRLVQGVPPLVDRFQGFEQPVAAFLADYRYRLALVEHFWCAPYLPLLTRHADHVLIDLVNIESEYHRTESQASQSILERVGHRRFASLYRRLEAKWLPAYSEVLTTSELDRSRIAHHTPLVTVYPNSIPRQPVPAVPEEEVVAFSANFDYHPNQIAVAWFAQKVWPALAAAHPALRWRLIGMNPESVLPLVRHLPRVEFTGSVTDAVQELAKSLVVVVPLQSGSGTRLKIIEAWAAARPVVSTPIGAEGLPHGGIALAAAPEDFTRAVDQLLQNRALRESLGARGRCCFEQSFTWEAAWRSLSMSLITPKTTPFDL